VDKNKNSRAISYGTLATMLLIMTVIGNSNAYSSLSGFNLSYNNYENISLLHGREFASPLSTVHGGQYKEVVAAATTPAADFKSSQAKLVVKDSIVNRTLQVGPGNQSKVFVISVPSGAVGVRLVGSYSTKGGSVPVVHFNLVDASRCAIPKIPPSCYTHVIDEISSDNFINRTLAPGKAYELYFSNEANVPDDSKSITARFLFEHLPFLVKVKTGEANTTISLNQFMPSTINVKVGQNVTWYNPSQVPETHTVTFVLDSKYMAGIFAPFSISGSSKLAPFPGDPNSQPVLIPSRSGTNTTITLNQRAFRPVVIDESGHLKDLVRNANYTVLGTEKYINSGFILPAGQEKSITGSSNKFTLGFTKPGKYDYFDSFHPWMTGTVIVR
jgi:plastocyanin